MISEQQLSQLKEFEFEYDGDLASLNYEQVFEWIREKHKLEWFKLPTRFAPCKLPYEIQVVQLNHIDEPVSSTFVHSTKEINSEILSFMLRVLQKIK